MTSDGTNINNRLDNNLAPYAQKHAQSLGRQYPERIDPNRSPFQRDRDRIIHTTAFRRLKGKMQVVSPSKGDHYRNRLTHTIEVAQIARDLARELQLNEDLAEAIALAHDLGHPPFGHAGERALHQKMKAVGRSFEHNQQSLRIVESFEPRYQNFPGLNLTLEVREGMQKHNHIFYREENNDTTRIYSPHLESQLVDMADSIAYLSADIEDGLRGGFFTLDELMTVSFVQDAMQSIPKDEQSFRPSLNRALIRSLITKLIQNTQLNLIKHNIKSLKDVQNCKNKIISLPATERSQVQALKQFLMERYYQSPSVSNSTKFGIQIIAEIFEHLQKNPETIHHYKKNENLYTQIADFIAGMTDRFAEEFYKNVVKA
jgi:dGTPase